MMMETLFAMDLTVILAFMGAGILLNLTPGADVLFATACGMTGGWRAGVAAAMGISLGSAFHIALAALGISAALIAIPHAYDVIRYLGAAYLVVLAIQSWRANPTAPQKGTATIARAIRKGFMTNALNPKVALFIVALLPQFTDPTVGPIWHQIIVLGTIFTLTGLLITSGYGALAGVMGQRLQSRMTILNKASALIFGGLAARLAFD